MAHNLLALGLFLFAAPVVAQFALNRRRTVSTPISRSSACLHARQVIFMGGHHLCLSNFLRTEKDVDCMVTVVD